MIRCALVLAAAVALLGATAALPRAVSFWSGGTVLAANVARPTPTEVDIDAPLGSRSLRRPRAARALTTSPPSRGAWPLVAIRRATTQDRSTVAAALASAFSEDPLFQWIAGPAAPLDRADREGVGAYLESTSTRNIPFYARHGFAVRDEISCGKGAPVVTAMWRDTRG